MSIIAEEIDYPELKAAAENWQFQPPANLLSGKTVAITGAGAGIGATTAKTLASFGANIVLIGRSRKPLETVFDWIEQNTSTAAVIVPCDLENLSAEAVDNLSHSIRDTYGNLDGLIHNASMLGPKVPIAHYPPDEWQRVMQTNVTAPFLLTRGLFDALDASANACVLYISSSVGREGRAYWGAYSASKFALEGLSQIFADETENAGRIKVYSINPGATRTGMRAQAYPGEDPLSVPLAENHMQLMLWLLQATTPAANGSRLPATGSQLDARTWTFPEFG